MTDEGRVQALFGEKVGGLSVLLFMEQALSCELVAKLAAHCKHHRHGLTVGLRRTSTSRFTAE
eukprot:3705176-Lingulodinium_polyedra.AAC.1